MELADELLVKKMPLHMEIILPFKEELQQLEWPTAGKRLLYWVLLQLKRRGTVIILLPSWKPCNKNCGRKCDCPLFL